MRYANLKQPRRKSTWFAYLAIPVAVQHKFDGKKFFQKSTGRLDAREAHAVAAPWLLEWRDEIARAGRHEAIFTRPTGAVSLSRLSRNLDNETSQPDQQLPARQTTVDLLMTIGILRDEIEALKAGRQGDKKENITLTPILAHLDDWIANRPYPAKQMPTAITHLHLFSEIGVSIESLTSADVQKWVDKMRQDAPNTIRNRLYSVKNYWEWMTHRGLAPQMDFKVQVKGTSSPPPERFPPGDIPKIIEQAYKLHEPLGHLSEIGAYSGIRREAIGLIKVMDVTWGDIPHFTIREDKTLAGRRQVPIHSKIHDLIRRLITDADRDGFLIHTASSGDWSSRRKGRLADQPVPSGTGSRTDALGKRFSKMKTKMGFDHRFDFHSLRRTVIHLFEIAECPEGVAQDVVGHKKKSMTYGTYSGITPIELRAEWLEKAIRY